MDKPGLQGLLVVLVSGLAATAQAVTWQVGPSRSYATPTALFNAVSLQPGDVIEVDGNATYPSFVVPQDAGGTAGNPLVIRGIRVSGQRPHIAGGTNTVQFELSDHVVLEGFEITGGASRCVFLHAHDITVRDSVIHACPNHGILSADQDSGSFTLEYSEIYDAGSELTRHPLYIQSDEVAHPGSVFRMQHNYVHDGNGGNLLKSRHERNEIRYNWFEGAAYHELELIGPDETEQAPGWTPELVREDSDVVGNVIVHPKPDFNSVIRVGGDGSGESRGRTRFVNNTIVASSGQDVTVFRIFDGIQAVEAHNNVLYASAGGTLRVERTVEANWVDGRRVGGSNNWVQSGATYLPAEWTGTLQGANPGLVNPATFDFTPAAGSALVDAGDSAPQPIPGYAVPNALFPPTYQPQRSALAPGAATPRAASGTIDIGAIERAGDLIFANGFES